MADGGLSSQFLYEPLDLTASVANIPTAGGAGTLLWKAGGGASSLAIYVASGSVRSNTRATQQLKGEMYQAHRNGDQVWIPTLVFLMALEVSFQSV